MKVNKSLWLQATLGELFDLQMGKTPSRKDLSLWENGDIPWVSISDMNEGRYISKTKELLPHNTVVNCRIPIIPIGTVIMSFKLTIGKTCIVTKPLTTNEAIMAFYPTNGIEVNPSFLAYALSALKWKGNRAVKGITINKKTISEKSFLLPALVEQESIAMELDMLQEVIDGYKAQISDLDALAQSIFLDTFGDPITNPKGWEVNTLKNLADIGTGSTPSRNNTEYYDGTIPWVKSTEVRNVFIFETQEHITEDAIRNSNCSIYPINTILIAMYGQGKTRGQVGLLKIEATTNQACAAIQCSDQLNHLFAFWHFQMCYEANRSLGHGTNQKNMNLSIVGNMRFIVPPLSLQEQFAKQVNKIERQKELLRQQLADAEMLMAERMQYYFS